MSIVVPNVLAGKIPPGYIVRQKGSKMRAERTGLASARVTYRGYFDDLVGAKQLTIFGTDVATARSYKTPNPFTPSLLVYSSEVTETEGVLNGLLEIEYRGLDPALAAIPPPIYELQRSTSNEPLITHPDWEDQIAGNAEAPINGAQFSSVSNGVESYNPGASGGPDAGYNEDTGVFKQWLDDSIFRGRDDYLVASSVFLKTYTSFSPPTDMGQVGKFSNPDGPAPSPPEDYAWFYLGETSTDEAGLYRIQASWRLVPTDDAAKIIYGG